MCSTSRISASCSMEAHFDDGQQLGQLAGGTVEIVGGEQPQGDHLDSSVFAPLEEGRDVGSTGSISVCDVGPDRLGPAPVTVQHHPDMLGHPVHRQTPC